MHYRTLKSKMTVRIHPSSILSNEETRPKLVLFHEVVVTSADYMRQCSPIEASWISEVAPHFWKSGDIESSLTGQGRKMPKGVGAAGTSTK
jgi:pre-mRNA-splicing factor ATP-dependent RNA helicase DHX16